MTDASLRRRLVGVMVLVSALALLYFVAIRPWHRSWGATDGEVVRALPGDEIAPHARRAASTTHAITIDAPPSRVWPWLAQIGQDRGGFYSFEILEDLVGCEMTNSRRILADEQTWQLGDKLWMYPERKLDGMGHAVLRRLIPGAALGFATHQVGSPPDGPYDGSWSFVLEPRGAEQTRLLIRGRAQGQRSMGGRAFDVLAFEPMHFIMERRMMENVKALAEGSQVLWVADTLHVGLWGVCVLLASLSLVFVFRRQAWRQALLALGATLVVLQCLLFVQPSLPVGLLLVVAVGRLVWFVRAKKPAHMAYVGHPPPPLLPGDVLR